jgi:putative transposase
LTTQANSYAERFVRTIKESCLERLVLFGEKALRKAVREFMTHYHSERNHQGIGNLLIVSDRLDTNCRGPVRRRQRLGGMLNYYDRTA